MTADRLSDLSHPPTRLGFGPPTQGAGVADSGIGQGLAASLLGIGIAGECLPTPVGGIYYY